MLDTMTNRNFHSAEKQKPPLTKVANNREQITHADWNKGYWHVKWVSLSMPVAFLPISRMGMRYSGTDWRKTPAGYLRRTSNTKLAHCDCKTEVS